MEWSLDFLYSLLIIIFIDLILAGDNAVVIALAARKLEKEQQKKVIIIGTAGAIGIRVLATFVVVRLLKVPWLEFAGGLLLIWIAYKLLNEDHDKSDQIKAGNSMMAAVGTIIVADATMGLDNVLAVAGAADGNYVLIILGLIISVPIIVWGSTMIIKWIQRFPVIIYIGAGVLAFTAAKMITGEPNLNFLFDNALIKWGTVLLIIVLVIAAGKIKNMRKPQPTAVQNK